jgi:hypothetical protein
MGLSFACFIGICAVLGAYDNKDRPEWAYYLSLNTIVSILATGCRSSMVFVLGEAVGQLK